MRLSHWVSFLYGGEMSQKCEQFSYELLFVICCGCWDYGPKLSPPRPPIPGVKVKIPSGGNKYGTNVCFYWFLWSLWNKLNNETKMIPRDEQADK